MAPTVHHNHQPHHLCQASKHVAFRNPELEAGHKLSLSLSLFVALSTILQMHFRDATFSSAQIKPNLARTTLLIAFCIRFQTKLFSFLLSRVVTRFVLYTDPKRRVACHKKT
jgi:hypothetical protein